MFSIPLAEYMMEKGFVKEARYIRVVNGWRRTTDERGLSSLKRCELKPLTGMVAEICHPWVRIFEKSLQPRCSSYALFKHISR